MSEIETNVIHTGDCFNVLSDLPAESVHAVVTDPPYGLAFMGRDWDDFEPKEYQEWCQEWATEVKRVLKPGGHLLAFSGNRTHHRLFTGVEDAGFEIRDTITWHYGSGFPKAADISKTIDKRADAEREDLGPNPNAVGRSYNKTGGNYNNDHEEDRSKQDRITAPATDAAKQWDGFKTGLKPATEYVVMARKPFDAATVDCVLEHGTGALNIDGCRIDNDIEETTTTTRASERNQNAYGDAERSDIDSASPEGRYPSNVIFDETEAERLDRVVGVSESKSGGESTGFSGDVYGDNSDDYASERQERIGYDGKGGPSRYFYTSKASKAERTEDGSIANAHPTVKPTDLMEWLVKLVTAENQIVLDPFAGSGTTLKAAKAVGRDFVGIEKQAQWADVARVRAGLTPHDPSNVRSDDAQTGLNEVLE